jgi:hypothetical protein
MLNKFHDDDLNVYRRCMFDSCTACSQGRQEICREISIMLESKRAADRWIENRVHDLAQ